VPLGASRQEVSQAYKKLAFMHHPDRVAGMGAEAREHSEERMKEINAAYSELRRRGA
jgi:DnaJ-class molecular chaperone